MESMEKAARAEPNRDEKGSEVNELRKSEDSQFHEYTPHNQPF